MPRIKSTLPKVRQLYQAPDFKPYRIYRGKRWARRTITRTKRDAQRVANEFREKGLNARVLKLNLRAKFRGKSVYRYEIVTRRR